MNKLWYDFRYTFRLFRRNPGHSALCIAVIAMSLGISLVVFSLVYNTAYKPLKFKDAERWVHINPLDLKSGSIRFADSIDEFVYRELDQRATSFSEFGAMLMFRLVRLNRENRTMLFSAVGITPNLLASMGIVPSFGRLLQDTDIEPGAKNVVMLNYHLWQNYYGGRTDVIGQVTRLNEIPYVIVGVLPEELSFPINLDLLMPLIVANVNQPSNDLQQVTLTPVGILAPNTTIDRADEEVSQIMAQIQQQYPDVYDKSEGLKLNPINTMFLEQVGILFSAMTVVVVIIVGLASLNIANLLISRAMERRQEFAVRNAVGSSRWQLVRQSLMESLLLCSLGAVVGLGIAYIGLLRITQMFEVVSGQMNAGLPSNWEFVLDGNLAIWTISLTIMLWLTSGLIPAWRLANSNVDETLKSGGKGATDLSAQAGRFRTTKLLVGIEIVTSVFLLAICGALLISISRVVDVDHGIVTDNRTIAYIDLPGKRYNDLKSRALYFNNLATEIETSDAVDQVAFTSSLPHSYYRVPYTVKDREIRDQERYPVEFLVGISPNYFEVLGVDLLEGRRFNETDNSKGLQVVIVDKAFANKTWPNESALGKQVQLRPDDDGTWATVVGVTAQIKQSMPVLGLDQLGTFYRPLKQESRSDVALIFVQTPGVSNRKFLESINASVSNIDADAALWNIKTLDRYLFERIAFFNLLGDVFLSVSTLTALLAATGIFAVISRSVTLRFRETGIRRALGSSNRLVVWIYLRQGLFYLGTGVVVGGGFALLAGNVLTTVFSDMMASLPWVLATVVVGMSIVIFTASYLPALKAIKMEPGDALHYE